MKMPFLPAIAIVAALVSPVLAADDAQTFLDKAAVGSMFEVQSSQLALQKSRDPDIKKLADMMVSDHGKVNSELKTLAREEGLTAPSELDDKHAARLKSLEEASENIETLYVKAQLDGYGETLKMYEDYADAGDNEALQNFAVKTLPMLRMHLDTIEQMGDRVGATD